MTPGAAHCFADQTLDKAATVMETHQIRRLPILNHDKHLIGILSLGDLAIRAVGTKNRELVDKLA